MANPKLLKNNLNNMNNLCEIIPKIVIGLNYL
jgi:hypothetical protein